MSLGNSALVAAFSVALMASNMACSTAGKTSDADAADAAAGSSGSAGHYMRHTLREVVEYDVTKMLKLVNREMNMKEADENVFLSDAANVLGQTVLIQTHFTEREAALRDLKGRLDQDDYVIVVNKTAENLLEVYRTSPYPSDQAAALVSLTNLVVEIKALKRPELKPTLQRIAEASLEVKDDAKKYARESLERLVSPSAEAQAALKTL